ncbi:MAG: type I-F CRISPR-associated protein Csy1 [Pseudomonadota bacterium]
MSISEKIADYIRQRKEEKLEAVEKNITKLKKALEESNDEEIHTKLDKEIEKKLEIEEKFEPVKWLTDAAIRAKQIQFVTHGIKYLHPDAKGTQILAEQQEASGYVCTFSIDNVQLDVVGNAASLDLQKLLMIECEGVTVLDCVRQNTMALFLPFTQDENLIEHWQQGFIEVTKPANLQSHVYAKQLYWPLEDNQYHLLLPLFASSLNHEVYQDIQESRFSEASKAARDAKKKNEHHEFPTVFYPQVAIQSFGGTKPQNISLLNSQRKGASYLLSCAPPNWKRQDKPPLGYRSIFTHYFDYRLTFWVKNLSGFLKSVQHEATKKAYKDKRASKVFLIIGEIFNDVANMERFEAGWSQRTDCLLSRAEQLWLDPHRQAIDESFKHDYEQGDWQHEVANNFARWLTRNFEKNKLNMGDGEHQELAHVFLKELQLMN